MRYKILLSLGLILGFFNTLFAAQRVVLCEDLYQED
jgi:hypothetical protein